MKKFFTALLVGAMALSMTACDGKESTSSSTTTAELFGGGQSYTLALDSGEYSSQALDIVSSDGSKVSFASSNTAVATVQDGTVTAVGVGKAKITATLGEQSKTVDVEVLQPIEGEMTLTDKAEVKTHGRVDTEGESLLLRNTASGFEVNFIGSSLKGSFAMMEQSAQGSLKVYVDGEFTDYIYFPSVVNEFTLFSGEAGLHTVKVLKMTEQGYLKVRVDDVVTDGEFLSARAQKDLKFEFYGDSISCGYGNLGNDSSFHVGEDGTQTYATMLAEAYDAECSVISYSGIPACLMNPNSMFTMQEIFDKVDASCGKNYNFAEYEADLVVINLGTNDANGFNLSEELMAQGYAQLLRKMLEKRPNSVILCVYGMMGINQTVENGIVTAVEQVLSESESANITYYALDSDTSGKDGHPVIDVGHAQAFESIKNYIDGRGLLN